MAAFLPYSIFEMQTLKLWSPRQCEPSLLVNTTPLEIKQGYVDSVQVPQQTEGPCRRARASFPAPLNWEHPPLSRGRGVLYFFKLDTVVISYLLVTNGISR